MKKNKESDKFQRVEKHSIKERHKLYSQLDELCFLSKNLYNYANYHVRQIFILCSKLFENKEITKEQELYLKEINLKVDEFNKNRKLNYEKSKEKSFENNKDFTKKLKLIKHFDKDNKYPCYDFIEFLAKDKVDYKSLMAQVSQQTLKLLDKNWISFFESVKKRRGNNSKFTSRPKLPKYLKKNGRSIVIFTNQNCKQKENIIQFPKCLNKFNLSTKINGKLQQVRILPRCKYFIVEIVYSIEIKEKLKDNNKYIGIDLGLDNLATIGNNIGKNPIIINGKSLKSINHFYNKKSSYYRKLAKRMNNLDYTNKLNRLNIKRNNKVEDYLHKASKKIVNYALSLKCNTIIIGNNKDWKRNSKLSKKVNQNFVGIPHQRLIQMIQYKAENFGLNVVLTEESYTSGTSFLDNELPTKENYNKKRRIKRGLFKSNKGILINADLNASFQIIKKVVPTAFSTNGIEGLGLNPIRVSC